MATSEDEVQKLRDSIEKKRQQVRDAQYARGEALENHARELEVAQLRAEDAALDTELERAKEGAKVSAIKEGNASNLQQAKDAMRLAQGKPVTTPEPELVPGDAADAPGGAANEKAGK